jgi:hypothetical protein
MSVMEILAGPDMSDPRADIAVIRRILDRMPNSPEKETADRALDRLSANVADLCRRISRAKVGLVELRLEMENQMDRRRP